MVSISMWFVWETGYGVPAISVSDEMESMQDAYRQIKRGFRENGASQEIAKQAGIVREAVRRCLQVMPDFILRAPDARRVSMEKEYRLGLEELDSEIVKLQKALQKNDPKSAGVIIKRIDQLRRNSHERLGVDD